MNSGDTWTAENIDVEPGSYLVTEDLDNGWTSEVFYSDSLTGTRVKSTSIDVVSAETIYVFVVNTYNPPVTTMGSITFVKAWEGDFEPESGYVNFTVSVSFGCILDMYNSSV